MELGLQECRSSPLEARRWRSQVYNLPETVRESDVEKLSFAVQLAEGFYAASQVQ